MASTPVSAADPEVNARRMSSAVRASPDSIGRPELAACGQPPMHRTIPTRIVT
jgi:hypothetical protein